MRALVVIGLVSAVFGSALARADGLRVTEPRAFGYFVGDTIERRVEIDGPPGETLVAASLPRPGPSRYWLELRSIETDSQSAGGGTRHALALAYQSFYVPLDPRKVTIPATNIQLRAGDQTRSVTIPAFEFVTSPVREIFPDSGPDSGKAQSQAILRPDLTGGIEPTGWLRSAALVSGGLAALLLVLLARHMAWWPFHGRPARPFTEAARAVGADLTGDPAAERYRDALIALHRAFDATAKRRLLAGDLASFARQHPEHAGSTDDIHRLFEASRLVFFADDETSGRQTIPPDDLRDLAHTLARQERAVR